MLSVLIAEIEQKKAQLDRLRPLSPRALANLEHAYDLELTYTSNAIEGNTLTQIETALVIEHGVTIGGKKLRDHLEAIDHYDAIRYMREIADHTEPLTESDVRNLHALVMRRSDPGRHAFPPPSQVPALMGDFTAWLRAAPAMPETAFSAHRRLVDIHPFNDGNGRTARLLMNLILIKGGYPPIAVRPEDRLAYLHALQESQAGRGDEAFERLLYQRLDATLAEYLSALREALPHPGAGA
jgi:Fic family protein